MIRSPSSGIGFQSVRFSLAVAIPTLVGIFGTASVAMAQSSQQLPAKIATSKTADGISPGLDVTGHIGSGIGIFQDIQVPVNEAEQMRADGRQISDENADHFGLPLAVGLGVEGGARDEFGEGFGWTAGSDALQIRASSGPSATQSSSYARVSLGAGTAYHFPVGSLRASVGGDLSLRRSAFSNVSNGHYVQSTLVGGAASLGGTGMMVAMRGAVAPIAHFGYYDGSMFSGHDFKQSETTVSEFGVTASFLLKERLGKDVWLDLGFQRESIRTTIDNIDEYDGFGLTILPTQTPSRIYDLATTMATIAVRKSF